MSHRPPPCAPVTRPAIRAALAARGLSPLHRFGQHFLARPEILDRMADLAEVAEGDVVLEPGPGLGGLTERLLLRGAKVVAVEVDRGLSAHLADLFGAHPGLSLLNRDVLARKSSLAPEALEALERAGAFREPGSWKVVSNVPYQISSPLLAALATHPRPPGLAVLTVQKEVGEVLVAAPGTPQYSPLGFLARLCLEVHREMSLPPSFFFPRPGVDSVIVRLRPRPRRGLPASRLLPFARRLFQGRRKTLRATLRKWLREHSPGAGLPSASELLDRAGLRSGDRIDTVDPERIASLAELVLEADPGGERMV